MFSKLRTPKTWESKCLKSHVWEDPSTSNIVKGCKHCENLHHNICIIFNAHSQAFRFKKLSLIDMPILGLFANRLAANGEYSVPNSYKLTIPIQMQLSQKQKGLSHLFAEFLNSRLNFKHFERKMTLRDSVFSKLRTPKTWLERCLRSPVSEDSSKSNMGNWPKYCWNMHHSTFFIFIDDCQTIELKKVALIEMLNLRTVC